MSISYSIGKRSVTMVDPVTGIPQSISEDHASYQTVVQFIKDGKLQDALNAMNVAQSVSTFSDGAVRVEDNKVMYGDEEVPEMIAAHVLQLRSDGFDIKPLVKFLRNLYSNPSRKAIHQTWDWLHNAGLTITEDGHFIAWKGVKDDYYDRYSGQFYNGVGEKPEMERRKVDDDDSRVCSYGFHVGTFDYADRWGRVDGRLMEIKVNPADVVAVANDGREKVRVSKYEVVAEVPASSRGDKYKHVPYYDVDRDWDDEYGYDWFDVEEDNEEDVGYDSGHDDKVPTLADKLAALPWEGTYDYNRFWNWLNKEGHWGFAKKSYYDQCDLAATWVRERIPEISVADAYSEAEKYLASYKSSGN